MINHQVYAQGGIVCDVLNNNLRIYEQNYQFSVYAEE